MPHFNPFCCSFAFLLWLERTEFLFALQRSYVMTVLFTPLFFGVYFWSINPHYFLFLIRVPEQTTFFCCTPPALLHSSNCLSDSTSNGASESCVLCSTHKGVTCSLSSTLPVGFFPERLLQNFLCSLFLAKSRTLHFCLLHVYIFWDDFRLHRWLLLHLCYL